MAYTPNLLNSRLASQCANRFDNYSRQKYIKYKILMLQDAKERMEAQTAFYMQQYQSRPEDKYQGETHKHCTHSTNLTLYEESSNSILNVLCQLQLPY